jgi:hypothetical protein
MKTLSTLLFSLVLCASGVAQSVWIVDNRPSTATGSHIFATPAEAITAATAGDIIHIIPSSVTYADFTITKDNLTIYGIGFNPNKDQPNTSNVSTITIGTGTIGTRISGMTATEIIIGNGDGSISNIFIENCLTDRITITGTGLNGGKIVSNVVIRNCVIGLGQTSFNTVIDLTLDATTPSSVLITNNVIMGSSTTSSGGYGSLSTLNAIIKNNLFLGNDTNDFAFNQISTSTISNNIFYGRAPRTDALTGDVTNSTFNNNISFSNTDNTFATGTGVVENGSIFTDPQLSFAAVDDWDFAFDPTIPGGSPAENAGNDATDIGITGGTLPFSTTGTPLPIIQVLNFPEIIKEGDNLNATIEAEGN